jgi:hypothetical protein
LVARFGGRRDRYFGWSLILSRPTPAQASSRSPRARPGSAWESADSLGRVQDGKTMWWRSEGALLLDVAQIGKSSAAGPRVRILFPPAGSLVQTGLINAGASGRHCRSRCTPLGAASRIMLYGATRPSSFRARCPRCRTCRARCGSTRSATASTVCAARSAAVSHSAPQPTSRFSGASQYFAWGRRLFIREHRGVTTAKLGVAGPVQPH